MRYLAIGVFVLFVVAIVAGVSRSDVPPPDAAVAEAPPSDAGVGSGQPTTTNPALPTNTPFALYDHGSSAAEFAYEALDPVNQAYVDANANQGSAWAPITAAYQSGVEQLALLAQAQAAAEGLGVENLANQGVVP